MKLEKCRFMTMSVEYLGHRVDKDGMHPLKLKIHGIVSVPSRRSLNYKSSLEW